MSAESNNVRDTLAAQLASFDDRLEAKANDVQMLAEIQSGIRRLLSDDGNSEAEIRLVLQERYDVGELRKETFQLVKSMLDGFVTEEVDTSPTPDDADDSPVTITDVLDKSVDAPVARPALDEPVLDDAIGEPPPDKFSETTVLNEIPLPASTAEEIVQVGSVLRDRFLLQERVSGGSMGVVYKALDRRLAETGSGNHFVAVKVLSPKLAKNGEALRALQQEAAKGRCLVHPNIVRFIDLDRDEDLYFIVMEWLEGRNLAQILDDPATKRVPLEQAFKIVRQIGDALDYAHRCGIVHADVKPGNIIITPEGDARLFDFGVARVEQAQIESSSSFNPLTLGAVTPAYSSMQVLTGDEPAPSDDVFSLACLLYRLLAGYRVFGPRNAAEAAEEGMKPQPLPILDDNQWRTVKKALSYARVTRFDSMGEFLEALDSSSDVPDDLQVERSYKVDDSGGGIGKWLIALVMILGGLAVTANQLGYLDEFKARLQGSAGPAATDAVTESETDTVTDEPVEEVLPQPELEILDFAEPVAEPAVNEEAVPEGPPLVDFTTFPVAALDVPITLRGGATESYTLTLTEDGDAADIEFNRQDTSVPLAIRLEEVGFSGNRSPWASGQYTISNEGIVEFPAGQDRGRITLAMAADPLREADQQSTLQVRDTESVAAKLATITVFLRDDDQRAFEAQLPPNTIAFATSQASVSEADPAAQLDILRFNPDSSTIVVTYRIEPITATENKDYFPPAWQEVSFGPGQRTARLLVPLVQDSVAEGDEAFAVDLSGGEPVTSGDVYQRIVVMIRDDE